MKSITEMSDKEELITKARQWYDQHQKHVSSLRKETEYSVPPSGSDVLHPELWKGIHWNWLFSNDK